MHSIERYGIVALLFLVVTVVAVLMWDGGKEKKKPADLSGAAPAAVRAPQRASSASGGGRSLELVAEPRPGPLARQGRRNRDGVAGGVAQPRREELESDPAPAALQPERELAPEEPPAATGTLREEPARETVVGRTNVPAPATHGYSVRSGDTLSEIAQRELGSARRWPEIAAANPGLDPARLQVGRTIQIPGAGLAAAPARAEKSPSSAPKASRTWKVGQGENLWKIAARALGDGKRWPEIAALNPRVDPDRLVLGQVLVLPATSAGKAPAKTGAERPTLVASSAAGRSTPRAGRVR